MGLENLKSAFSNIIKPDYDTEKGGVHGGMSAETPSQPPHPQSHTAGMETAFGTIGTNLSQHSGRHGGTSGETPSQPPHPETHSELDSKVGSFGSPQYAGVRSSRGIAFPFNYSPELGGIHGLRSPQPPHSTQHSAYDVGVGSRGVPQSAGMRTDSQITFPADYDPNVGGIHGDRNPQPHQTEAHSVYDDKVGTFGQPQLRERRLISGTGIEFPTNYEPGIGGLFGGTSTTTPSFPVHSATYSTFDDGVGNFGNPQYAGAKSGRGIAFPTDYDPNVGGIHGLRSPQPPHSEAHSLLDNLQNRLGFGPGVMSDALFGPSAFENMTSEELSPIENFASNVGSRGSGIPIGGGDPSVSLYPAVTVASNQQTYTVNSPSGFNSIVDGKIRFDRIPLAGDGDQTAHMNGLSPSNLEVDYFSGGQGDRGGFYSFPLSPGGNYSYASLQNYAIDSSPTIEGFTKNFNTSKYLDSAGVMIGSGLSVLKSMRSNYGLISLNVDTATNPFGLFSNGENARSYDTHTTAAPATAPSAPALAAQAAANDPPPAVTGYDWRSAHGTPTSVYRGQILNSNPYQGSNLDPIGPLEGLLSVSSPYSITRQEDDEGAPNTDSVGAAGKVRTYAVDFLTGGYSYTGLGDIYSLTEPTTIPGFTVNFNSYGYTSDTLLGSSKFLKLAQSGDEFVTTARASGLAPKSQADSTPVSSQAGYTGVNSKLVNFFNSEGYSYSYPDGSAVTSTPIIDGFTANLTHKGETQYIKDNVVISSGLAPKGQTDITSVKEEYGSGNIDIHKINFFKTEGSYSYPYPIGSAMTSSPILSGFKPNLTHKGESQYSTVSGLASKNWSGVVDAEQHDGETIKIHSGIEDQSKDFDINFNFANDSPLSNTRGWEKYYNAGHTPKGGGYHYGPNVSRSGLNIKSAQYTSRSQVVGLSDGEPYYVTPIGGDHRFLYKTGWSSRAFPLGRATQDVDRLLHWQLSGAGLLSMASQFVQQYLNPRNKRRYNPLSLGSGISLVAGVKFRMDRSYLFSNETYEDQVETSVDRAEMMNNWVIGNAQGVANKGLGFFAAGENWRGGVIHQVLGDNAKGETDFSAVAPDPLDPTMSNIGRALRTDHRSPLIDDAPAKTAVGVHGKGMGKGNVNPRRLFATPIPASAGGIMVTEGMPFLGDIGPYENIPDVTGTRDTKHPYKLNGFAELGSDPITTTPIQQDIKVVQTNEAADSEDYGMPFYIKDLRDGNYIVFRAYIDGIDETITPGWESENYIGRSEPVYTYGPTERAISMNLKLFAQTKDELDAIYQKLNRVTSLCYPEYQKDVRLGDKTRMKPPIIQFRLGELFGSGTRDMTGFITSLTYTYEDDSPWETEQGRRVPKYVTAALGFQVIHEEVPSLDFSRHQDHEQASDFRFYGINDTVGVGVQAATS